MERTADFAKANSLSSLHISSIGRGVLYISVRAPGRLSFFLLLYSPSHGHLPGLASRVGWGRIPTTLPVTFPRCEGAGKVEGHRLITRALALEKIFVPLTENGKRASSTAERVRGTPCVPGVTSPLPEHSSC